MSQGNDQAEPAGKPMGMFHFEGVEEPERAVIDGGLRDAGPDVEISLGAT